MCEELSERQQSCSSISQLIDVFFRCSYSFEAAPGFRRFVAGLSSRMPRIRYQASRCGIYGSQNGVVTVFSPINTVFSWQCHPTSATHTRISFIYARPYRPDSADDIWQSLKPLIMYVQRPNSRRSANWHLPSACCMSTLCRHLFFNFKRYRALFCGLKITWYKRRTPTLHFESILRFTCAKKKYSALQTGFCRISLK